MALIRKSTAIIDLLAVDNFTPPFDVSALRHGVIQATWVGANGFDATLKVQVSLNGIDYNDSKSTENETALLTASDSQIWEMLEVTAPYVRIYYTANSNTAGICTIKFEFSDRND